MAENQAYLFLIFTLNGVFIGLIFDFFRILRRGFKTGNILTYIEDILFWILAGLSIIYSMCMFSNGTLRFFMIIGIAIGLITYMLTISPWIIKVSISIINIIKNIVKFIINVITYPFKMIYIIIKRIIVKPLVNLLHNISKKTKKTTIFIKNFQKTQKNQKKCKKKKEFFKKSRKINI